jgi:hypothetical protein
MADCLESMMVECWVSLKELHLADSMVVVMVGSLVDYLDKLLVEMLVVMLVDCLDRMMEYLLVG